MGVPANCDAGMPARKELATCGQDVKDDEHSR